jgi:micrococcal nuclease
VIDGDTVSLICPEDGMVSARLMGFDTPEKYAPKCLGEFWRRNGPRGIAGADPAGGPDEADVHRGTDRYGRALVELEIDGVDVARLMVRTGHARAYGGGLRGSWC